MTAREQKKHAYTLIEVLVTVSMVSVFICIAMPFFNRSAKTTKRFTVDAFALSDIEVIKDEFRESVHSMPEDSLALSTDGMSILAPNGYAVELEKNSISFIKPAKKEKTLRLPKSTTAKLSVETLQSGVTAAVLTLELTPERKGAEKNIFHILAAPPAK